MTRRQCFAVHQGQATAGFLPNSVSTLSQGEESDPILLLVHAINNSMCELDYGMEMVSLWLFETL